MQPSDIYQQMLVELQAEMGRLERLVFEALQKHPHGLTREQLVSLIYRERSHQLSNNNTKDRKIRKAIQSLREKGVPIISNSGRAGYRLDASPEGRAAMLADLRSRRDRLNILIQRVNRFSSLPAQPPVDPPQKPLF